MVARIDALYQDELAALCFVSQVFVPKVPLNV